MTVSCETLSKALTGNRKRRRVSVRKSYRRPFKLTPEQVTDIRTKELTGHEYAVLYGVTERTIYGIWAGRTWT